MKIFALTCMLVLALASGARAGQVDRLYVIDCGTGHTSDQSRWSPGVNVGVPRDFSDNCYLIHHSTEGYILWDTGVTDRLVTAPPAPPTSATAALTWHRSGTLTGALEQLGLKPSDIRYVVISHLHPDHTGNVDEFPDSMLVMQRVEWDAVSAMPQRPFNQDHPHRLLDGDTDLFGDGSLTALSTPGHTPGHESLLVHLPKTGYVISVG